MYVVKNNGALFLEAGMVKSLSSISVEDKDDIVNSVVVYNCVIKTSSILDDIMKGLESVGVLESLKRHSEICQDSLWSAVAS